MDTPEIERSLRELHRRLDAIVKVILSIDERLILDQSLLAQVIAHDRCGNPNCAICKIINKEVEPTGYIMAAPHGLDSWTGVRAQPDEVHGAL